MSKSTRQQYNTTSINCNCLSRLILFQRKYNMELSSCYFIVIIYIINTVNGAAVTIADCGDPVAKGDPQVLTCHITGSVDVGINWFREGERNSIISCASNTCIQNNALYSVNSTDHPDNKQQFTINSVSADDFTKKWICVDGTNYPDPTTTGTGCTLSKRAAITTADCGDPVAEGDAHVLTCHITGSIVNGINWFREGDTNRIIFCTSKICLSNNVLYSVNSTAHPNNKQHFTINSVSAEDFTKKWICIDSDYYLDPTTTGSRCTLSERTAVTIADCGDPVAEGAPQILTCHITGSITSGINWFREGDTNRIIACGRTSQICISNTASYNVSSTPHLANKQQFTIKSVTEEDFTKKWFCVDGTNYPDPSTADGGCALAKRYHSAPPTASTPSTGSTRPTENTTSTTWTVAGCIMAFIAGLCFGILGVLIYLKRLNLHCNQTKKNSDTAAVTYDVVGPRDVVGAGDVNNYDGINMTESTDSQASPVYINQTTNPDHPPASNTDYINETAGDVGSNPVNTYEHLATAYTNENSYEPL